MSIRYRTLAIPFFRPALLVLLAGTMPLGGLAGCGFSGDRLNRDIRQLVREQNDRLRAELSDAQFGATLPEASGKDLGPGDQAKTPGTTNPTASEMVFERAPDDRDVRTRLQELLAESGDLSPAIAGVPNGDRDPAAAVGEAATIPVLTLEDALRASQRTGRELLTAQEDYLLSSIRLLQERHLWGPRLFNDATLTFAGEGDDGRFDPALTLVNSMRATQRLPSGGEVEARWLWNATENLREQASGRYIQSSELVLSGRIPLLRGAGAIAREDLIQAERDLVYQSRDFERFRREYLVEIASDYFQLLETRAQIVNQIRQLRSLTQFDAATRARVDAGRLEAFQTSITENRLRSAESALAGLRDAYILQLERFKVRLGLASVDRYDLSDQLFALPEPRVGLHQAVETALALRLDVQNSADRLADARRAVRNAEDGLLPDLDLRGEVGIPTDPDAREGGVLFDGDETRYSASATLSLPLDRERERLAIRAAQIRLERSQRTHQQLLDNVAVSVRSSVRSVELARFQLNLAEQQVEINKRRLRAQKLQEDSVDPQQIVDTENDLLDAENARDRARTRLRTAVLRYLLESDQLRVTREGLLQQLPGME